MNKIVRKKIIDVARKKGKQVITYQQLSDQCNLGLIMNDPESRVEIGIILSEVCKYEVDNGRPLLSSLVVIKDTHDVGPGFYKLCDELGIDEYKTIGKDVFLYKQMDSCYDHWKNDEKYYRDL